MNKKFNFFICFMLFPACAFAAAENETSKLPDSGFYQKFVTAAWLDEHDNDKEALKLYKELDAAMPEQTAIIESICYIAIDEQDSATMDKYIPLLLKIAPERASSLSIYGTWLWSKGRFSEALSYYKKAIQKDPENPETVFKYVTLLTTIDSDKAIAFLKDVSKKYPKISGLVSAQIANLYLENNDLKGAEEYLKQSVEELPGLAETHIALAKIYESEGKPDSALAQYLEMEQSGLADSETLTKIGAYYILKKQKSTAMDYFIKAKKADNANPAVAQFLAADAEGKGDYSSALKYLKDSRDFDKTPSYWIRASYYLDQMNDEAGSVAMLRDAYKKFNKNAEVGFYYTFALFDLKDYKTARGVAEDILKVSPDNKTVLFQYAFILEKQKKYSKMQKVLLKVIALDPNNANALNFLGYYLVDKTDKTEEGGNYIKRAIALDPKDPAFTDSLAWYYYKSAQAAKALDLLKGIDVKSADDPEIYFHFAAAYEAQKDYEESAKYYRLVLKAEPDNKAAKKGLARVAKKQNLK